MVGIAETRQENIDNGLDPGMIADQATGLVERYGMPLHHQVREAVPATVPACRAVVAARMHAPEREWPLLRRLRVRAMSAGGMLDDQALIDQAASDVGIDPGDLNTWTRDGAVQARLEEDLRLARQPTDAALALKHKLGRADGGWRYTPPSYEFSSHEFAAATARYFVPGMQSTLAYETAIANLAPHFERRREPQDVSEVLRWAGYPLASQEVAEVCGISRDEARDQLAAAGAVEERLAGGGYWAADRTTRTANCAKSWSSSVSVPMPRETQASFHDRVGSSYRDGALLSGLSGEAGLVGELAQLVHGLADVCLPRPLGGILDPVR